MLRIEITIQNKNGLGNFDAEYRALRAFLDTAMDKYADDNATALRKALILIKLVGEHDPMRETGKNRS